MRQGVEAERTHLRPLDALGVLVFVGVALAIGWGSLGVDPADLRVYHLAAGHILADDVYAHTFPNWPYVYPPSALLVMLVLGSPLPIARVLLLVASVASVWVTLQLIARASAPGTQLARPAAVAVYSTLTLLSWPLLLGLGLGQIAPVVMGLAAVGMLGRQTNWSGAWVGTATAIKLTPALFVAHLWATRRRRGSLVAVATTAAWFGVAAVLMPASSWDFLGGGVIRADDWYAADAANVSNQALTGVAARIGLESAGSRLVVVAISAALLVAALIVARRLHDAGWGAAAVAMLGVWTAVAAPVGWIHAFGWWVPLAVAVGLTGRRRSDVAVAVAVLVVPALLLLGQVGDLDPQGPWSVLWFGNYAVVAVVTTAWLWWRVRDIRPPASP